MLVLRWALIAGLVVWAWRRRSLTTWILVSMALGAEIGHDWPAVGQSARLLSQIFLRMIKTIIAPLLFATLVVGIAGHSSLRQVGRMGVKALVYFEVVTTIALVLGLVVVNLAHPGAGMNVDVATLDTAAVAPYMNASKGQSAIAFLLDIIPTTVVDAFARGAG